jgi:hypothetical protein
MVKTGEEHLRKVVSTHLRDWDGKLPIYLLAYRAPTHGTTGTMSTSMVLGREQLLPCDLFGAPPTRSNLRSTTWQTLWISCITSTSDGDQ